MVGGRNPRAIGDRKMESRVPRKLIGACKGACVYRGFYTRHVTFIARRGVSASGIGIGVVTILRKHIEQFWKAELRLPCVLGS